MLGPRARTLERGAGPQHQHVVEAAADDLEIDRQSVPAEPARPRRGRLARQIERIRERDPRLRLAALAGGLGRVVEAPRERPARDRGRQQEIVLLEERAGMLPPREPIEPRLHVLRGPVLERGLDDAVEPGLDLGAPIDVGRQPRRDAPAEDLAPALARPRPGRLALDELTAEL